jgi:hypothetical protein
MNDTSNGDDLPEENVLRPFEPSETAPLPPSEPSKVVPERPGAFTDSEITETITLPLRPFLIGLGVLFGVVALFAVLWLTAGNVDTDRETAVAPPSSPAVVDAPATDELERAAEANEEALVGARSELTAAREEQADLAA